MCGHSTATKKLINNNLIQNKQKSKIQSSKS